MANLIRGLSENGGVVFCGVDSTQIVRKAEKLHTTSATCSAALGRLLIVLGLNIVFHSFKAYKNAEHNSEAKV